MTVENNEKQELNNLIEQLRSDLKAEREHLNTLNQEVNDLKNVWLTSKAIHANADSKDKSKAKQDMDRAKIALEQKQNEAKLCEERTDSIFLDITTAEKTTNKAERQESSVENVEKALEQLNAHYIASESKWYLIYSNGIRYQPIVKSVSNETMKDLILRETGWVEQNELSIKKIAQGCGRMYRDVERTFMEPREGVLNQLTELRDKFWLKPIFGQPHHFSFDILFDNLVDGNKEYKDQILKYLAYSYVKPEDIFAPNIDSSAVGGAGRDTIFRIIEIIFTEECCGEANGETFTGTHNGDLWGKVWIKISERNSRAIDYNEFKNLTGGHNFRLRRMGENATQQPRTFRFFIMNNGYGGTIQLSNSGSASEDRRVEPVISNMNLRTRIANELKLNDVKGADQDELTDTLQQWQEEYWQNEEEIAKFLGNIITQFKPEEINKLLPLHGIYYNQRLERQKNAFNHFMNTVVALTKESTCYSIPEMYKIYKIATNQSMDKNAFAKRMCEWLLTQTKKQWEVKVKDVYKSETDTAEMRVRRQVVYTGGDREFTTENEKVDKLIFDVFDFIDEDVKDDKGNDLGDKVHINNVKGDLL
jgi:hypothetical protein